jgi:hypothetical protein
MSLLAIRESRPVMDISLAEGMAKELDRVVRKCWGAMCQRMDLIEITTYRSRAAKKKAMRRAIKSTMKPVLVNYDDRTMFSLMPGDSRGMQVLCLKEEAGALVSYSCKTDISIHALGRYIQFTRIRTFPDVALDSLIKFIGGLQERQETTSEDAVLIDVSTGKSLGHFQLVQDGDKWVAVTFVGVDSYNHRNQNRAKLSEEWFANQGV